MKIIHVIYPVIGIMLALMLCITPVAAVSGSDFEIVTWKSDEKNMYKYCNMNDLTEKYIYIFTHDTRWLYSLVTFKPANIPDAPTMVVKTTCKSFFSNEHEHIYLPMSVDEWEIKYYSNSDPFNQPDPKYLKNAGVVKLKTFFNTEIKRGESLKLDLTMAVRITAWDPDNGWSIPSVD